MACYCCNWKVLASISNLRCIASLVLANSLLICDSVCVRQFIGSISITEDVRAELRSALYSFVIYFPVIVLTPDASFLLYLSSAPAGAGVS